MRHTIKVLQIASLALTFTFLAALAYGQKYLQLERLHSTKTKKYLPGDEITFQLNNGQWYTRVIDDISYEKQFVLFANGHVAVDSIVAFRSFAPARWSRPLGNQFINFAAAWATYSIIYDLVDGDPNFNAETTLIPAGTSTAIGLLLKKLFKHRTYRIKRNKGGEVTRWRLRTLDLSVK